jgi:hypothetical protein
MVLVTMLLVGRTPAFYLVDWRPWARYMISICIVVVLVVITRGATIWINSVL